MLLYVATSNPGKLRDFATAAANVTIADRTTILPLPGLSQIPAPAEDQPTFEGNAILKARFYSHHAPGQIVVADDSGLEVDCLNGEPGVRSARYADDVGFPDTFSSSPDERNNAALLRAMDGIPPNCRHARYRCVLAAARDGEILHTASGTVEGQILLAPQGEGGFGYDPLFFLPELNKAMSEIDLETKLTLSHRGRALASLLIALQGAN
jgi:XTP/dITP diphosphohydrolase